MSKWEEKKLKDIAEIITGNTPNTSQRDMYGNVFKFIKATDIQEGIRTVNNTEEMLSEDGYNKYKKHLIPKGVTCVVTIGTLGKKMCLTNEPCFTNQAINAIKHNKDYDGRFIYYRMKPMLPYVKFLSSGTASGRENVSKSSFSNIKISIPDLPTQERIADILSAYDDLIENNNRRIELLEKAAQELYKEWFVRFRFPNHENTKFVNGLPEGWEVKKLGDCVEINKRSINREYIYEIINYFEIGCVSVGKIAESTPYLINNSPGRAKRIAKDGDVIWGMVRPNLKAYSLVLSPLDNDVYSTGFAIISSETLPFTFTYLTVTQNNFVEYLANRAGGSAYPAVNKSDFERAKVLLPTSESLVLFHNIVEPNYREINQLQKQNQNLKKQRDLLLPRLMSGKLEV